MSGEIGEIDDGYVSFISSTDDKETEIFLGELSIEEGKQKLENLEFSDEEITEEDLKEMIGFDYEDVKYFDNALCPSGNIPTSVWKSLAVNESICILSICFV